jgi:aromatic-L-amino-acid decarboxylase
MLNPESTPPGSPPTIVIDTFKDEYQRSFAALNLAWIEEYFRVEPLDVELLGDPRRHIVATGGEVFMVLEDGTPKATCAMHRVDQQSFELIKMAVAPSARGRGYAKRLMDASIAFARERKADRILIRSHTSLRSAIALYRKYGFVVTGLGPDRDYARSDIRMELDLRKPAAPAATDAALDPQDWSEFRALAHRMVDETVDFLSTLRERPAWVSPPQNVREALRTPAPWEGQGGQAAYDEFLRLVRPYSTGNIHPRFWGWVQGSGAPMGVLGDFLAAAMNPNAADFDHSPALVEMQVMEWFRELMGFPEGSSGLFVSGGSAANFTALAVARNTRVAGARERGVSLDQGRPTVYASQEVHSSLRKAVELLGLGEASLRLIRTREDFTIDLEVLRRTIAHDRAHGMRPFCVVGNAGTVNTGAIDPLAALADLCAREEMWFHVDGAFGALGMLSPAIRPDLAGLERADSVIFDFHKWLYAPYEAAGVLVRWREAHRQSFSVTPAYLQQLAAGVANAPLRFSEFGLQLSRGFRALKVWMAIKADGLRRYSLAIERNVAQARHLAERVQRTPELELLAPVPLNVVNFRYCGLQGGRESASDELLNAVNQRILVALQESGFAVPSSTLLGGRFSIRCAIVNHRSTFADFDALADEVVRLGRSLTS